MYLYYFKFIDVERISLFLKENKKFFFFYYVCIIFFDY